MGEQLLHGEDPDELVIAEGGAATTAYARLQFETLNQDTRTKINEALLRYCELEALILRLANACKSGGIHPIGAIADMVNRTGKTEIE